MYTCSGGSTINGVFSKSINNKHGDEDKSPQFVPHPPTPCFRFSVAYASSIDIDGGFFSTSFFQASKISFNNLIYRENENYQTTEITKTCYSLYCLKFEAQNGKLYNNICKHSIYHDTIPQWIW